VSGSSIYLAKLDASGKHVWSKRFGDANKRYSRRVAMDSAGNIVVIGNMLGPTDFGGGPLPMVGTSDGFVAKFDAAGNHMWSKQIGNVDVTHPTSLAIDDAGNVVVSGDFQTSIDLGGGMMQSAGQRDLFVAKLDAAGNHVWSKRFGGVGDDAEANLDVDKSGNLLLVGHFPTTIDFGAGSIQSAGDLDLFVAKLDAAGNHVWSKRFGDANPQSWISSATDPAGNIIILGSFMGTIDLGGGPHTSTGMYVSQFVAKLDAAGGHAWTKLLTDGSPIPPYWPSVSADGAGNVLITGMFTGTSISVPAQSTAPHSSQPCSWRSSPPREMASGPSRSEARNTCAHLVGVYEGDIDFGSGPLASMGMEDVFIAKFAP
jgi:hypothetical protein